MYIAPAYLIAALILLFVFLFLLLFLILKVIKNTNNHSEDNIGDLLQKSSSTIDTKLDIQGNGINAINDKLASFLASLQKDQAQALQKISENSSQRIEQLHITLGNNNKELTQQVTDLRHNIAQQQEKDRTTHAKALQEISDHFHQQMQSQTTTLRSAVDEKLSSLIEQFSALRGNIKQEQERGRTTHAKAIQEIADRFNKQMDIVRASVTEKLHEAVEKQMESSFQRVVEQFQQMQQAMGEIRHMTSQVGDLKRLFSNVKARGGWGEAQLKTILDDILPPGAWQNNVQIGDGNNIVEFAIRIPVRRDQSPLLAIDSKFPTESYERLLQADEKGTPEDLERARKEMKKTVKFEAQKISQKYIHRPQTVDYAIMYVPTDSLYMEITRIPGLLDEVGRKDHIYIMGPVLMAALLRTIHLGYVNVALDEHTATIARLLAETQQEMFKMDEVLEKLAKQTNTVSNSIDKARQRTRVLKKKLDKGASSIQDFSQVPATEEQNILMSHEHTEGEKE